MSPKELFGLFLGKERVEAIRDLEMDLRAKGSLTQAEDATLREFSTAADVVFPMASTFFTLPLYFSVNQAHKLLAIPPPHRLLTLGYSAGGACILGKLTYYQYLYGCAVNVLNNGEERMKMELANIILTKHSNEKSLVKHVKKHFIAEHLFSDQHQDSPLFSWRQRHSYVDSSFVERMKETEANNSAVARPISGRTTVDTIGKDPLACIGSPDINNLSEDKSTILRDNNCKPTEEVTGIVLGMQRKLCYKFLWITRSCILYGDLDVITALLIFICSRVLSHWQMGTEVLLA